MNAPVLRNAYVIRRIRLINFHNIQNETIEVENGGHIFFLGDNGSGKTTVLDAVHYVLTAGEMVEFNSAARVAGQRVEGRRVQGIIMRYNTETGPLNTEGGVTYAALELKNERNQVLTLGLGMTVAAMDEPVQRWGMVVAKPLEGVPFLVEEMQGMRPRTRLEMKEALDPIGGFYNVGPFRRELIYRLFNNEEVFADVCRLLRIGKAYREIVAQSSDYHELFMRLMPEPKTEIFENVILSLQSLEDSKTVLEDFERKRNYINELAGLTEKIRTLREDKLLLDWLVRKRHIERLEKRIAEERHQCDLRRGELDALADDQASIQRERTLQESRLADLETRDHAGLVRQEKDLLAERERMQGLHREEEAALAELTKRGTASQKRKKKALADLRSFLEQTSLALNKRSLGLPFSLANLVTAIDYLFHKEDEEIETPMLPVAGPMGRAREEVIGLEKELALLEKEREDLAATVADEEARVAELREASMVALDDLPDFREARVLLQLHDIEARPLFEGLEWRGALSAKKKSAFEELIGTRVLATFLVPDADAEKARRTLLEQYPSQRITYPGLGVETLPDWFATTFDLKKSNRAALRCLAAEMASARDPEIRALGKNQILSFRAHERKLSGRQARLIGADGRRKAHAREVRELEKALKGQVATARELDKRHDELTKQRDEMREVVGFLEKTGTTYRAKVAEIANLGLTCEHLEGSLAGARDRFSRLERDQAALAERLTSIQTVISKEGLTDLEGRIARAREEMEKTEARLQEMVEKRGGLKRDVHLIEASIRDMEQDLGQRREELRDLEMRVREICEGIGDVTDHVAERFKRLKLDHPEQIVAETAKRHDREVEARAVLRARMSEPSLGAAFSFVYEEEKNLLVDRRSRTIDELLTFQRKTIEDQRQVINEKTFHLFKEIIMRELVNELRKMVFELEDIKNKINDLLEKRRFGNCLYRFSLTPRKQYRHLVDIIASLDLIRSEPEKELRAFFEDHKEEIINTEAGEIPDLLDYRNWYLFEMQVTVLTEDGAEKDRIAMTRRVKSIGSGGEQAVPNYLLILAIAHFLYSGSKVRLETLLFDEAFYGIDAGRRDQLLGFAGDLGLQLFVASPDQDGVKREIDYSTTVLIVKDANYDVHTYKFDWKNPEVPAQVDLFEEKKETPIELK